MKYFYYVVVNKENDKYGAYVERVREGNDIKSFFEADNIDIVHPCVTFKDAKALSAFWNECYKKNGEYKPNRYRIAEIETENDDMKETIEKYEEEIEAVHARNRELEKIVYRLRNEVEALKEERTFLEAVTANSDNEIMKLKAKLYDLMTEKGEQTMAKKKEYRVMIGIINYKGEVYDESVIAIFYSEHRAFHYKDMCNEQTIEGTVYWVEEK